MARVPDVVGLPLDEARAVLAEAGIDVGEIVETRPPALSAQTRVEGPPALGRKRRGLQVTDLAGPLRVIRVRGSGPVDLVVTRERYITQQASP